MKKNGEKPILVLLGSGKGAYFAAKAFYGQYHKKSYVFGAYKCKYARFSRIIRNKFFSGCRDDSVLLPEIISFAKKRKGKNMILLPCTDAYVTFVSKNIKELSKYYKFSVPNEELAEKLTDRRELYRLLDSWEIPHQKCVFIENGAAELEISAKDSRTVLLPTKKTEYWNYPFPDMKSAYFPKNSEEALAIARYATGYGYPFGFFLEKRANSSEKYVYTVFISEKSNLDFGVFAKVILENSITGGMPLALITEEKNEFCEKLQSFLHSIGYRGFGSFYITRENGDFSVCEFSISAGVMLDVLFASGIAPELCLNSFSGLAECKTMQGTKHVYWHSAKHKTVMQNAQSVKDKMEARNLKKTGKSHFAFA